MLGEVDCGFVIWVRSKKYNISIDNQINESITNLFNFIKNEVLNKYSKENEKFVENNSYLDLHEFLDAYKEKMNVTLMI